MSIKLLVVLVQVTDEFEDRLEVIILSVDSSTSDSPLPVSLVSVATVLRYVGLPTLSGGSLAAPIKTI